MSSPRLNQLPHTANVPTHEGEEVMQPYSFLSRAGMDHGSLGLSPLIPTSVRYMAGYRVGRAAWDTMVSEARM